MGVRKNEQMGFVDAMMAELGSPRSMVLLERLDAATPWEELVAPIRALPEYNNPGAGHPPWCPALMLKCLMLAKWFNLSDPGLEEALKDRISFRRFVGLSFTDKTPDETTFVRFRDRLREAQLHETIFRAVVGHMESQGLLVKEGTMVDATIIEAPKGRPRPGGTSTRDPDASFTRGNRHGYKGHVAADLSKIITDYRFGTAKENETKRIDELIQHETVLVLADSAYSSDKRRAELRARGIIDGICYQRKPFQTKLKAHQLRLNRMVSPIRRRVEHPFAMIKQQLGYRRVRYRGRVRNEFDFALILTAANIKRSLCLRAA